MSADNRDWYKDWWRKKHGHIERAAFRISAAEEKRRAHRSSWRTVFLKIAAFFLVAAVLIAIKRA